MLEKIKRLANKIQDETLDRFKRDSERMGWYPTEAEHVMRVHGEAAILTHILAGKKYTKIDVGHSGKYMIDNETQEIFGIKGYGVINKKKQYGTLDTIDDYYWGGHGTRKKL